MIFRAYVSAEMYFGNIQGGYRTGTEADKNIRMHIPHDRSRWDPESTLIPYPSNDQESRETVSPVFTKLMKITL